MARRAGGSVDSLTDLASDNAGTTRRATGPADQRLDAAGVTAFGAFFGFLLATSVDSPDWGAGRTLHEAFQRPHGLGHRSA